jgi:hypothetical protein
MPIQLQLRRGLASQWLEANATLANGEIGYETDTGFFKIGTGNTAWANLRYTTSNTSLFANNASFLNGNTATTFLTYTDNKSANAYSNAVSYVDTRIGVVNSAIVANASAAYNNAAADSTAKATAAIIYSDFIMGIANTAMVANAAAAYTNATTFSANATNLTNGTIPYGRFPANIINTTADFTRSGVTTFNANLVINTNAGISANGSYGTQGQALLSNGSSVYWATATAGSNTYIQFNDSGAANASAGFTFDKTTNTVRLSDSNSSVNATINSTAYTGSASFVGGNTAATLRSYSDNTAVTAYSNGVTYVDTRIGVVNTAITSNASAAYTNAVSYTDSKIATANTAMSANAATAYSNAVTYIDSKIGTANTAITGNAAAAYANAVTYTDTKIGTANTAMVANAAAAYTNAVSYVDTRIGVVNTAITANASAAYSNAVSYTDTKIGTANTAMVANAAAAYSNAVSYVDSKLYVNTSQLSSNLSNYLLLSGGTVNGPLVVNNNLTVTGNLTLSGNTLIVGANNLIVSDALISLHTPANLGVLTSNDGKNIGLAFHYYDTEDKHAMLYRENSTGRLQYHNDGDDPSSNTNPQGNNLGIIQAASFWSGNSSVYATTNATNYSGTANNALYVGSVTAANVVSNAQLSANLANYQTTAGLAANVVTLTANLANYIIANTGIVSNSSGVFVNSNYISSISSVNANTANNALNLGGVAAASYQLNSTLAANVATLTANNTSFVGSVTAANVVSNAQLSANLANYQTTAGMTSYQTTAGLSANVATLTSNNTSFVGAVSAANVVSNSQLSSNLANYQTTAGLSSNVATLTANNTSFVGTVSAANVVSNTQLSSNLANYQTTAGLAGNVAILTANNANNLGGVAAASYVNTTGTYTISGVHNHTANVSVNGAIIANGGAGTSGQVLTSSAGGNVYWSTVSGGGGFTNGQSISVANLAVTGSFTANGSVGTSGQALVSTGSGVQWGALSPGYNYSSQFNSSSSQYLTTGANSLTSENFTIECWFYISGALTYALPGSGYWGMLVSGTGNVAGAIYFVIGGSTSTPSSFAFGHIQSSGSQPGGSCSTTIPVNAWNHVALSRSGSTFAIWFNGVKQTVTTSGTPAAAFVAAPLHIGASPSGGSYIGYFPGYISNFRIVKGTPVYDPAGGNITVPTSPLSVVSGTYLLTCNAITPSDSSTNNFQITNNGGVTTSAVQSPFTSTTVSIPTASLTAVNQQFVGDGSTTTFSVAGGYTPNAIAVYYNGLKLRNGSDVTVTNGSTVVFAVAPQIGAMLDVVASVPTTYSSITPVSYSVSFNGSSQYLTVPSNAALTIGTSSATVEFWMYPLSSSGIQRIICSTNGGFSSGTFVVRWNSGTFVGGAWGAYITSSTLPTLNAWNHVAWVGVAGASQSLYLNGVLVGTNTSYNVTEAIQYVGCYYTGGGEYYNGYLSNVRVVKGVAVYTGAFMPPTTPLSAVQSSSGTSIQAITGTQTSLLTCNGPTIIDGSTNAFTITNNGAATVSTAIVPTFTNVTITRKSQTQTFLTSGSGTYYTPAGVVSLKIRMVGGGGGGGGSGTTSGGSPGTAAGAGANTVFGTSLLTAVGGSGGGNYTASTIGGTGGAGGSTTIGSGATGFGITGGAGGTAGNNNGTFGLGGCMGGASPFGGAGLGGAAGLGTSSGGAASTNSGSGGAGGGAGASMFQGTGGGAGGYLEAYISNPSVSYAYIVGAGGTSGGAGTSGYAGGAGGSGIIIIEENY